jgi:hypothetical protein
MFNFSKERKMQVDSSRSQQNVVTPVTADQNVAQSTQGGQPRAQPAVYDTSAAGNTQQMASGSAGSTQIQQGSPPADLNAKTYWHLGPNGEHVYEGYTPAPNAHPTDKGGETPWDVFKRGFEDGATHPATTMGKVADIANGDETKSGEKAGEEVDATLQKLPIVGEAMTITQGLAGQKNPDGTPILPEIPNVQPDAGEHISARPNDKAPGAPAPEKPSMSKSGEQPAASTTSAEPSNGASARPPSVSPKTAETHGNAPIEGDPRASPSSASSSKFDVPAQYSGKPSGNLAADRNSPGIFKDEKGQSYIQAADKDWPVRYDKDNGTWRAYSTANASKPQYPVQLDEKGNWQVHNNVGLKGGGLGDAATGGSNASNRDRLAAEVQNSPSANQAGSYPGSVGVVNNMLQRFGINLSSQSAETIINNVHQVDAGELAHAAASSREVWTFAKDVADPNLSMKDRSAAALGMVLNGVVAPASMAQFDLENYHYGRNQTADLRQAMQRFIQNDPHS